MPPGEISVTCPECGGSVRVPIAAIRRDSTYCSQCGKRISLHSVQAAPTDPNASAARPKRRPYRPTKRR